MNPIAKDSDEVRYIRVKGKALSMIREFLKVYPEVSYNKCINRIIYEVLFAMREEFGDYFKRSMSQKICKEIKEIIINEF